MKAKKNQNEWWQGSLFEDIFNEKGDVIENYLTTQGEIDEKQMGNDTARNRELGQSDAREFSMGQNEQTRGSRVVNESGTQFTEDTSKGESQPTLESNRQRDRRTERKGTENGNIPKDEQLQGVVEPNANSNDKSYQSDGISQRTFSFTTEPDGDVSIDIDDSRLRGGAQNYNQQGTILSTNGKQSARTFNTVGLHEGQRQRENANNGILGNAGESRNSILLGLQNDQTNSDDRQTALQSNGNELGGTASNGSFQGESGERGSKKFNESDNNTRSNSPSTSIYSNGNSTRKQMEISLQFGENDDTIKNSLRTNPRTQNEQNGANANSNQSGFGSSYNNQGDNASIISSIQNQDFTYKGEILVKGKKDRFYKNYEAIKLTKELTKIKQEAIKNNHKFTITKQEQQIISQFTGWGGVAEVFDETKENFKKENRLLKDLLTQKEYEEAKSTMNNAYFTPQILVDTIHEALQRTGLNNDENKKRILEPSAGNGAFLKQNANFDYTTIEKNPLSSNMLSLLFPTQTHYNMGYEDDLTSQNIAKFDAIIGNPPFGNEILTEKNADMRDNLSKLSLHNFFATKSASYMLKDDGIMAFVISTGFLDSKISKTREEINKSSTFLGAVRLPEGTFDSTQTSTDIVFFQKGKNLNLNYNWLKTQNFKDSNQTINDYFIQNPQNVLGTLEIDIRSYGEELICKKNEQIDIKQSLNKFIKTLPENIYKFHKNETTLNDVINLNQVINGNYFYDLKENNYFLFNDEIYVKKANVNNSYAILCKKTNLNKAEDLRVRKFIEIRDTHKKLIGLEKSEILDDDEKLISTRAKLNELMDDYHKKCGYMHNSRQKAAISKDIDCAKIMALEKNYQKPISKETALKNGIQPKIENCEKANILLHRVIRPRHEIVFDNEFDGLTASINKFGEPNISYIAKTLYKDSDKVANTLIESDKIYLDPVSLANGSRKYIISAKYLSGDVRNKLKTAENLSETFSELSKNVKDLKKIIPVDLKPSEIDAPMGASWIPLKYYNDFFEKEFGIQKELWHLSRSKITGEWTFDGSTATMSVYNENRLSFGKFSPYTICTHALQNTSVVIKKNTDEPQIDQNGDIKFDKNGNIMYKQIVDAEKTAQINNLIGSIREKFNEWIWKDYDRRNDLAKIYNDTFNCYAHKHYDGEDLKLDNLNSSINLRKHQKDAIFRAINEHNCLFDHEVGAGKTLTAICSVMKQKELGIVNKALIAVPNHLVNQWSDEFYNAYPNANLLVSDEKSISPENREEFFGKIMNGDYDAIIISHSQLEKIPVPPKIEQQVISRQIDELEESIKIAKENDIIKTNSIKQMQKRVDKLRDSLQNKLNEDSKSKALNFSDLGVDYLVVDESHMYKNLPFSTHLKVKGLGNQAGSKKALSMLCFTSYMNENDKKILFLTGTPISNSLTELYNINKYLMPKELEEKNIGSFDAWASSFAKIENVPELNATAQNFKMVSRFTALNNLPEVCGAYSEIADIVTNTDIKKHYKHYVPEVDIIKSISPISTDQRFYIGVQDSNGIYNEGSIISRMEKLSASFDPKIDNHLKCTSDAKKAGIDFRLINPNADDYKNSKINKCVENIVKEYHNWDKEKGTQLVFLDIGTPHSSDELSTNIKINDSESLKKDENFININEVINEDDKDFDGDDDRDVGEKGFFLYGDLFKKLVKAGIPREEIAFIHDANGSNAKKLELFNKVNSGDVRVLIGSTAKMGAGTNVQERVTAIHHFDVPWRPSDFIQRNGRVIRQGNVLFEKDPENFRIKEFRYITENTYDAVSWQIIETKAKSLVNFRKGLVDSRTLSGFEEEAASAAEMKAAATGNPLILDQVKLKSALDREELSFKGYQNDINNAEDTIITNKNKVEYQQKTILNFEKAKEILKENISDHFRCTMISDYDERKFDIPKEKENDFIKAEQEAMNKIFLQNFRDIASYELKSKDIMKYKGFVISGEYDKFLKIINFNISDKSENFIFSPDNLRYNLKDNNIFTQVSFAGFVKRLNNFLNDENFDKNIQKSKDKITILNQNSIDLKLFLEENKTYKNQEELELLRKENKIIMSELEKSSKNPAYKSSFKSKFLESQNLKNNNRILSNENSKEKNKEIL